MSTDKTHRVAIETRNGGDPFRTVPTSQEAALRIMEYLDMAAEGSARRVTFYIPANGDTQRRIHLHVDYLGAWWVEPVA